MLVSWIVRGSAVQEMRLEAFSLQQDQDQDDNALFDNPTGAKSESAGTGISSKVRANLGGTLKALDNTLDVRNTIVNTHIS